MSTTQDEILDRPKRAVRRFKTIVRDLVYDTVPTPMPWVDELCSDGTAEILSGEHLWPRIRTECERQLGGIRYRHGTLAQAVEWETLKLQSRLSYGYAAASASSIPLFRDRHVHIGALISTWRGLALQTEDCLAMMGHDTLLDVGPWGGFNFVVEEDGYTRMPFARLTLAVGSLPSTPLEENGGPFFDCFLPRYQAVLAAAGEAIPPAWDYQHHKRDADGRLVELSCTYHFPYHTYERRAFIKIRLSRACETVEEVTLQDFLVLLERLHFTSDWSLYREQTQTVDARFDLQDFISLNHLVEGVYQRTGEEDRLLRDIKEAFRGAIREPAVLYRYWDRVRRSKWIENLYWAMADAALGVKKYQRPVSFSREVCPALPPRLLLPVRRHLEAYHRRIGGCAPAVTD